MRAGKWAAPCSRPKCRYLCVQPHAECSANTNKNVRRGSGLFIVERSCGAMPQLPVQLLRSKNIGRLPSCVLRSPRPSTHLRKSMHFQAEGLPPPRLRNPDRRRPSSFIGEEVRGVHFGLLGGGTGPRRRLRSESFLSLRLWVRTPGPLWTPPSKSLSRRQHQHRRSRASR